MRLRFVAAGCFWVLTVVAGFFPLVWDALRAFGAVPDNGAPLGRDFMNVWTGGRLALEGNLSCLYDHAAYMDYLAIGAPGLHEVRYYSYPPHSLFLAAPFGLLPYIPAFVLWSLLTGALFVWAARSYTRLPILAVLTPAALINLWSGQYGFLTGALWLLLFAGHRWSAALLTIKPHLGILLPVVFLWRRWGLASAIVGTVALIGASVLVFGPSLWPQYQAHIAATHGAFISEAEGFLYERMMTSPMGVYRGTLAPLALHLAFAVPALMLWWRARNAPVKELAFITATVTFLILPYSHSYDLTVVGLGLGILLLGDLKPWERAIVGLAYLVPFTTMLVPWATPPLLLAALWVQVSRCSSHNADAFHRPQRAPAQPSDA